MANVQRVDPRRPGHPQNDTGVGNTPPSRHRITRWGFFSLPSTVEGPSLFCFRFALLLLLLLLLPLLPLLFANRDILLGVFGPIASVGRNCILCPFSLQSITITSNMSKPAVLMIGGVTHTQKEWEECSSFAVLKVCLRTVPILSESMASLSTKPD